LLVHAFWFAGKLAAADPVLTHKVKLVSGRPLPLTMRGAAGLAGFMPGRTGGHEGWFVITPPLPQLVRDAPPGQVQQPSFE
jgi:hypothetical protein